MFNGIRSLTAWTFLLSKCLRAVCGAGASTAKLCAKRAGRVVGRIYANYCPSVGHAKRDDAAMMVKEPTDGFERGLDEGEGFFEFQSV